MVVRYFVAVFCQSDVLLIQELYKREERHRAAEKKQIEIMMDSLCIVGISARKGTILNGQVGSTMRMITASSWDTAKEEALRLAKEDVFKEDEGWLDHQTTVHDLCWMLTDWKDETNCQEAARILEEVASHAVKLSVEKANAVASGAGA